MPITLRPNEQLVKVARKHYAFVLPVFFSWPLLLAAMLAARYGAGFDFFGFWRISITVAVAIIVLAILYRLFIWRSDVLIITNQRVVENDQRGIFSKTVTELLFRDIMETSYTKDGINASMMDYGDIKIKTASESEIVFDKISDPDGVVETINMIRQGHQPAQ